MNKANYKITITGRVQGVGFRPHVYRQALEGGLFGYINNSVNGVEIEISGDISRLDAFVEKLKKNPPPLAVVESFFIEKTVYKQYSKFEILHSDDTALEVKSVFVSPDLAVCKDCAFEIFDKTDRRHGYAFTNCTNCGPRYTITRKLPYDRPVTTMAGFRMCKKCQAEYDDPADRRFHAQPDACHECGPGLAIVEDLNGFESFESLAFSRDTAAVIKKAASFIRQGRTGALMGLGGFHIACRADSDEIIMRLRDRKNRPSKPFALMAPSMEWIEFFCKVSDIEKELLRSCISPVTILKKRENHESGVEGENIFHVKHAAMNDFKLSELVAPDNNYFGFMLPYTPMHLLLMSEIGVPLIMTSANISDEPICYTLRGAAEKLSGICDFAMAHNREILTACDDSVCFVERDKIFTIRPSRGIAPLVISASGEVPGKNKAYFSVGAILKNTVSFNLGDKIVTSQYIGDTDNVDNFLLLSSTVDRFKELYNLKPDAFICDRHPGSNSAAYAAASAREIGAKSAAIGHHYAHALSVMAENKIDGPVIALTFDGTGFGDDKSVWGGEFLICSASSYERAACFEPFRVVNYDGAVKNVSKLALCAVHDYYGGLKDPLLDFFDDFDTAVDGFEKKILLKALYNGVNAVKTSSLGRIFDIAAALAGFNRPVTFEGEAAVWLEMLMNGRMKDSILEGLETLADTYPYKIRADEKVFIIEHKEIYKAIINDRIAGTRAADISYKFHRSIIKAVYEVVCLLSDKYKINEICLSGGVFYNRVFLCGICDMLERKVTAGRKKMPFFKVYLPERVSFGDSCISIGQCYYALKNII